MNIREPQDPGDAGIQHPGSDDALAFRLRGLRRELPPASDLWPAIAARIGAVPGDGAVPVATPANARTVAHRRAPGRLAPWALAASLVLAVGVAWQQRPGNLPAPAADPAARVLPRAADAMAREYDAALRELQASTPARAPDPSLRALDQGAAQIRIALAHDPESRFLLERLRATYEKRLRLTQRSMLG